MKPAALTVLIHNPGYHTCLYCAVERNVWCQQDSSFTYGGPHGGAEISQSVLSASAGKSQSQQQPSSQLSLLKRNTNSNSAEKAQEKRHNVLYCCVCVCVLKCMHMCDYSPLCMLYIFLMTSCSSCSNNNSRVHFNQLSPAY